MPGLIWAYQDHFRAAIHSTMTELTHGLADFPFGLFVFFRLAAVPLLLALGESYFAFGDPFAEVHAQGNDGQALVVHLSFELIDLFLVQEQLPRTQRTVVKRPSRKVFANMEIDEPHFAAADYSVGIAQVASALAERFYFRAKQHHAGFKLLKENIIVGCSAILSYQDLFDFFFVFLRRFGHGMVS